jgi:hypothetical protein
VEDSKKIITRAVYGNRIQTIRNIVRIPTRELEKLKDVLGCTINGAKILSASIEEGDNKAIKVRVNVGFEVHMWYLTDKDTKVHKVDAKSSDIIEIKKQGTGEFSHEDVSVWMKENPKFVDATIISEEEGDLVAVQLEYVLEAEIIGETLLNVKVFNNDEVVEMTNEAVEVTNKTQTKYFRNF